jgi:hypothetical protein
MGRISREDVAQTLMQTLDDNVLIRRLEILGDTLISKALLTVS